ncbi:MAG: 1-deoxy-D-xylulose-5-phosphate reductoisomerase [Candidatus Eisenbacteria bacterium]|nr:1-deoxy-D-xylulose-5-phosphate reductoisomerase [Candidatus Eisenbacteria bacterium]
MERRRVILLGSTGSIGRNTIRVVGEMPDRFRIVALAARGNGGALEEQIAACRPEIVALADREAAGRLAARIGPGGPRVIGGEGAPAEILAAVDAEILVNAVVGAAGLRPTLEALGRVERICLANKESLVAGGAVVMEKARRTGTEILPIDSEHGALHQCLEGRRPGEVRRLVLTASGGPFRDLTAEALDKVTVEDALAHPTWKMGRKITIDSATLMNKGLEVIEAMHLFGYGPDRIEVVIHPQSVIHSLVEFVDGSYVAQLGETDMRHPIRYALSYPWRPPVENRFDLSAVGALTFERPDTDRFPCLAIAYGAARRGGTAPAVMNAANETAVESFLAGEIRFQEIPRVIARAMERVGVEDDPCEEDLFTADRAARVAAGELLAARRLSG